MSQKQGQVREEAPAAGVVDVSNRVLGIVVRGLRVITWAAVIVFSAWLARVIWNSLDWPIINDAPLFHYAAWRISEGAVPYRDVFDFQFPGTLLTHLLVVTTIGPGDVAWRIFDLGWLVAGCVVLWRCVRPFGALAALTAMVSFCLWHMLMGAWQTGQRDYCMAVLLMGAAVTVARILESEFRPRSVIVAGLLVGWAAMIKPMAVIFAVLLVPFVIVAARRAPGGWSRALLKFALGLSVAPLVCTLWLWWSGGLPAFLDIVFRYLGEVHRHFEYKPPTLAVRDWLLGRWSMPMCGLAVIGLLPAFFGGSRPARRWLLFAGLVYGLVHAGLQAKGWLYHFYPAAIFAGALAATTLERLGKTAPDPARAKDLLRTVGALGASIAALVLLGLAVAGAAARIARRTGVGEVTLKAQATIEAMRADLRAHVPPGGLAQVVDWGPCGVDALLRERIAQPTRLSNDFPMFIGGGSQFVSDLRAEFLADLRRRPPAVILVCPWVRFPGVIQQYVLFPELKAQIEADYRLEADRGEYLVYVPKSE